MKKIDEMITREMLKNRPKYRLTTDDIHVGMIVRVMNANEITAEDRDSLVTLDKYNVGKTGFSFTEAMEIFCGYSFKVKSVDGDRIKLTGNDDDTDTPMTLRFDVTYFTFIAEWLRLA